MSFEDIIDNLCLEKELSKEDVINLTIKCLDYLNRLHMSRYKAAYFGCVYIGTEMLDFESHADFVNKYTSICILIMRDLYNEKKNNMTDLVNTSLYIIYAMLSHYISEDTINEELKKRIKENDKYCLKNGSDESVE